MSMIILGTVGIMMLLGILAALALEAYFDYTDHSL